MLPPGLVHQNKNQGANVERNVTILAPHPADGERLDTPVEILRGKALGQLWGRKCYGYSGAVGTNAYLDRQAVQRYSVHESEALPALRDASPSTLPGVNAD